MEKKPSPIPGALAISAIASAVALLVNSVSPSGIPMVGKWKTGPVEGIEAAPSDAIGGTPGDAAGSPAEGGPSAEGTAGEASGSLAAAIQATRGITARREAGGGEGAGSAEGGGAPSHDPAKKSAPEPARSVATPETREPGSEGSPTPPGEDSAGPAKIYSVDLAQSWTIYQAGDAVVIDARPPDDYSAGHWKGAMMLPTEDFDSLWPSVKDRVPRDRRILIYCNGVGCDLAERLADELRDLGYKKLFTSTASYQDWLDAGHPVAQGWK